MRGFHFAFSADDFTIRRREFAIYAQRIASEGESFLTAALTSIV